jgi:hypothetical protein
MLTHFAPSEAPFSSASKIPMQGELHGAAGRSIFCAGGKWTMEIPDTMAAVFETKEEFPV